MSSGDTLIWGEPFGHAGIIQYLSKPLIAFTEEWPVKKEMLYVDDPKKLSQKWVANLSPPVEQYYLAQRDFMLKLFASPALERGIKNWGVKEVRLTADDAYFLKWLFPKCKIILLYRNPYDSYRSYYKYNRWYDKWPNEPIFTPKSFGLHWTKLTASYLKHANQLNSLIVPYEQLMNNRSTIDKIEDFLNLEIDRSIITNKLGTSFDHGEYNPPPIHMKQLHRYVHPLGDSLGYKRDF